MSRSWSDPPRPRRRHWLSWATENPLFGVAAVALIAGIVVVTVTVIRDYAGPKKYVTVEFFDVDIGVTSGTTTISLDRVTYQPGFDIRLSSFSRTQSKPLVIIDGTISNDGTVPVVAFFLLIDHPAGVLVSRPDGNELISQVNTTEAGLCPNESSRIPIIEPGRSRGSVRTQRSTSNINFGSTRNVDSLSIKTNIRPPHSSINLPQSAEP